MYTSDSENEPSECCGDVSRAASDGTRSTEEPFYEVFLESDSGPESSESCDDVSRVAAASTRSTEEPFDDVFSESNSEDFC